MSSKKKIKFRILRGLKDKIVLKLLIEAAIKKQKPADALNAKRSPTIPATNSTQLLNNKMEQINQPNPINMNGCFLK
jgi:hypothetical protein